MKISVCLIVKNEETVLKRCLNCVKSFADEIIVVDTGSCDNTREIAKCFTKNVFDFVWCDNFSKARNFAFSRASCDYLMWLDADDIIATNEQLKIQELKKSQKPADTYMFKYVTENDNCNYSKFYFYRERLMKKCDFAKFNGFVHEYVVPFGKIKYCDIEITHKKTANNYSRRNIEIYNANIKRGNNLTLRDEYYFAKEFFYLGEYQTCKDKILPLLDNPSLTKCDLYDCYLTLYKCEQFLDKANVSYLFNALEKFQPTSELLCLIALYYESKNNLKKAKSYYKMAVCVPTNEDKQGFKNSYYDLLFPLLKLVFILYNEGRVEQSFAVHQFLQNKFPNNEEVKYNECFFKKLQK